MMDFGKKFLGRLPYPLYLALSAFLISVVIIYFYSPRFVTWQGLHIPPSFFNPEVNRGNDALKQLANPFETNFRPNNSIIRWRLLFPLVGHALHFPDKLYLSMPYVGALLVFAFMAHVAVRETKDRLVALLIALLSGTTSWFFVSSGWLGYFDSWYVLALLLIAFSPSRRLLLAACLLGPWVDERFILALPVVLFVRRFYFHNESSYDWKKWKDETLFVIISIAPYILIRLAIIKMGGDQSESVKNFGIALNTPNLFLHLLLGIWNSFRGLWFFVGLLFWIMYRYYYRIASIILGLVMLTIFAGSLYVAGDVTRSLSMFLSVPLLGIFYGYRHRPQWMSAAVPLIVFFNLVAPASHVMTAFTVPIFDLRYELSHLRNPPMEVSPLTYTTRAEELIKEKKFDDALTMLGYATRLKPDFARAYFNIGYIKYTKGQYEDALTDFTFSIRYDTRHANTYYYRGLCYLQLKNTENAASEFTYALRVAPPDWPLRVETNNRLQAIPKAP